VCEAAHISAIIHSRDCFVFVQQRHGSNPDEATRRKVPAERQTVPVGDAKFGRRRKLPAVMKSYIKPRRKRRLQLSANVNLRSSCDVKSKAEDFAAKSSETKIAVKPSGSEVTGRFTSASIVSRYRHLDQQRSQTRRMSGRILSAESGTRPSTRSQTAAIMHRQLVMARMKSHDETELETPPSKSCATTSKDTSTRHRSDLSPRSQTSEQRAPLGKRTSSESFARRSTSDVKKEVSGGEESERSMRRFIRRRNIETSDANRG